jgi:methanogenic corrinoid protein MtbC1
MKRDVLLERFFTSLINGQRPTARELVSGALKNRSPMWVYDELLWPTLEHIQKLHRGDQLSNLSYHYAMRLLRAIVDQMQTQLEHRQTVGKTVLLVCGQEPSEELAAQMACDMLEARGYEVYFAGGGIASDEIVNEVGQMTTDILVIFGAVPQTVPMTRTLIDHLHSIGVCPTLQIVVGGGVFNRADGLAEEIGSDLWARTPVELVEVIATNPHRRMNAEQRTVGGKRRLKKASA